VLIFNRLLRHPWKKERGVILLFCRGHHTRQINIYGIFKSSPEKLIEMRYNVPPCRCRYILYCYYWSDNLRSRITCETFVQQFVVQSLRQNSPENIQVGLVRLNKQRWVPLVKQKQWKSRNSECKSWNKYKYKNIFNESSEQIAHLLKQNFNSK
jgi:hypothetical protein